MPFLLLISIHPLIWSSNSDFIIEYFIKKDKANAENNRQNNINLYSNIVNKELIIKDEFNAKKTDI